MAKTGGSKTKRPSRTKAIALATSARNGNRPESELQVAIGSSRVWNEYREVQRAWDAQNATAATMQAANLVGAPANFAAIREAFLLATAELSDITVSFEGQQTKFNWGSYLPIVNAQPYRHYFMQGQTNTQIVPAGSDPILPSAGGYTGVWGNVVLNVLDCGYSSRFGGSFYVTLAPTEDCGIELRDVARSVAIDLHQWVMRLYVQPSAYVFNVATLPASYSLAPLMHVDIESSEHEAYQLAGSVLSTPAAVTDADIENIIRQAEADALPRLDRLARFMIGHVHAANIPTFNRTTERVDRIHVSNGSCRFEISTKSPMIEVQLKIGYLFTSEGLFDDERELTAKPWIQLRTPPYVVLSREREKYIGNAQNTGWMTMGHLSPGDILTVHEVTVFPGWSESDPGFDDHGGHYGSVFTIDVDDAALQARIAAANPGNIGSEIYVLTNDPELDWTSYSIQVRFVLAWR